VELVENSVYYRPVTEMPGFFIPNQKQYVILRYSKLIKEKILPSYGKLAGFLERDYLPFTAASVSLARFKQGADWYQYLVEQQGAQISAKELHQQALALLVQLRLEIDEIKQQMDFKGGVAEFFEFLDNSPAMQYQNPTQVLEHFRKLSHQVNLAMPQLFSSFPRSTYQVKLANRNEQRKERVFYQLADYNKALPGVFWVNAEQITEHRVWRSESLFLQYGVPGAFYLAAIEQEVKRQPEFRKGWNQVAFREGWSLYAMSLGSQLGLYKEPLSKLGKIRVELEKIALMAADTGIHALGWEPLQAESFLQNNLFISQQRAAALVQFIALYPGRSIAPGVGLNTFRSLRQWGESSKPEQFDIRQFHALLIEQGAMPLPVLEHWVKEQLKHNR
jgi:uncharacterized protein (DUF885 family)